MRYLRYLISVAGIVVAAQCEVQWKPVSSEELALTACSLEPDAPAEVLEHVYEVNDRPNGGIEEYVRYKIYKPELAVEVTRLSKFYPDGFGDKVRMDARLTLPDGTQTIFGTKDAKDRKVQKQGAGNGISGWLGELGVRNTWNERFLAVEGIVPGSILECRVWTQTRLPPFARIVAQRERLPVRQYTCVVKYMNEEFGPQHRSFLFNSSLGTMEEDQKKGVVTVTARDLPSLQEEPHSGPLTDSALALIRCYEAKTMTIPVRSSQRGVEVPRHFAPELGPWAYYSGGMHFLDLDHGMATKRVQALALDLTTGAKDDREKAVRIHSFVRKELKEFSLREKSKDGFADNPDSLDDVLDWRKRPTLYLKRDDFHYLAIGLYRAAGFDVRTVMLPDRRLVQFFPDMTVRSFLAHHAIVIKWPDRLEFSDIISEDPLPFGLLPWHAEGRVALPAMPGKPEFINVPSTLARKSVIASAATLTLDASGNAEGDCLRRFTGQTAVALRQRLQKADEESRIQIAKEVLDFKANEVELSQFRFAGIDDPEKPLDVKALLKWPGLATVAGDRLILRPELYHGRDKPEFTASQRRAPVQFKHPWQEVDVIVLRLPEGFSPDGLKNPAASPGKELFYNLVFQHISKTNELHVRREFVSNVIDVRPAQYPPLKQWYEMVTRCDQSEIVLSRSPAKPSL